MASIYANGAKNHHKFTLAVSAVGTSREGNFSTVSFQFTLAPVVKSYDWRYWGNSISYKLVIGGKQFSGTIPDYDGYSTVILQSGNLTVPHNADGTKVLSFQFSVTDKSAVSYTCGDASASGQMELPRILRTPPALSATVEDSNPATVALTGDKGRLVRYASHAAFSLTAIAYDGAQIVSTGASCGGKSNSGLSGVFEKTESGHFAFTATDSYGNTAKQELSLEMIAYVPLTCDFSPNKPNAEGKMTISVSGNCFQGSFGAGENTLGVFFRYRESGGSFGDWIEMTANRSGNSYTAAAELTGLDYQKTYVFQAKAEDALAATETAEYTAKAIPVFDWGEGDFNINGTLKLNGVPVADHIIEQGNDGAWSYRKWESGLAECWYKGQALLNFGTQINGLYFAYGSVSFPFAFVSEPLVCYSLRATNGFDFCGKTVCYPDAFNFYLGSTVNLAEVALTAVDAYAVGRWR